MAAFKCGFALVKSEKRWTVVRVDACKGYDYQYDEDYSKPEDTTPHHLDEEYFLDKPWQLRVMMEAEDQLESNNSKREGGLISKHPEIPNDRIYMNGGYYSFESQIAAQEQWQRALETLTNRQRQTILLWKEGYNQGEIGKLLGVTQSAVSQHLIYYLLLFIFLCFSAPFPEKGQTAPISGCGESSPGDCKGVQIGTGEHGVQTVFVFRQSAVHRFLIAELTLDDPKCVLYLTAHRGLAALNYLLRLLFLRFYERKLDDINAQKLGGY